MAHTVPFWRGMLVWRKKIQNDFRFVLARDIKMMTVMKEGSDTTDILQCTRHINVTSKIPIMLQWKSELQMTVKILNISCMHAWQPFIYVIFLFHYNNSNNNTVVNRLQEPTWAPGYNIWSKNFFIILMTFGYSDSKFMRYIVLLKAWQNLLNVSNY